MCEDFREGEGHHQQVRVCSYVRDCALTFASQGKQVFFKRIDGHLYPYETIPFELELAGSRHR